MPLSREMDGGDSIFISFLCLILSSKIFSIRSTTDLRETSDEYVAKSMLINARPSVEHEIIFEKPSSKDKNPASTIFSHTICKTRFGKRNFREEFAR